MPTVFELNGYRFFFYSNENNEPIHINKSGAESKYWIYPKIAEVYSYGFKLRERKEIKTIIAANTDRIIEKWNEFFK